MIRNFTFIAFCLLIRITYSQVRNDINYDLSCLGEEIIPSSTLFFGDIESGILNSIGNEVTIEEEINQGKTFVKEIEKEFKFIKTGEKLKNLESILYKLTKVILKPRCFNYKIFLIDSTLINAFTIGGNIIITTGMYSFCKDNNELACIIGHEISHNELGHINNQLKRSKTANSIFGDDLGNITASIGSKIITPFNQKDEAHCDLLGIDLAYAAGFEMCSNVDLWKRMSKQEGKNNIFISLFSSHPYSLSRALCSKKHIEQNYKVICNE